MENVSISPEHFTRSELLCLAKELARHYEDTHKDIFISVFDDPDAASQRPAIPIEARPKDYEIYQHEHASYMLKAHGGENYLIIEPDIWYENTHTKLPLDADQLPRCAVEINQDRCLMIVANHLRYPQEAWRDGQTGSVVVAVTVAKNGLVTEADVVDSQSSLEALRNAALKDARSWRFEPGSSVQEFRVTYRFELAGSAVTHPNDIVRYQLPDEVVITANPSR